MILVPPTSPAGEDNETVQHHRRAWLAYYTYLTEGLEHRKKVFRWQYTSSLIIFFTVLLLVFIGIIFSGIQFYRAMRSPAHLSGKEGETMQSEIEAGPGGIKVSSPVLGVVILTVSLAFFYLYLVYVYPIKEIF